ncbi:retinoic acid receptor responder protein 2-like isoform 1-T3 [Anomaloglossus baeobatrachus]|uniref:retinoic acid receptor responder protein 2-like n=1 Tax=Anomaloglossus baeobatrachus TaxID=238106 RepID=UPI003F5090C8
MMTLGRFWWITALLVMAVGADVLLDSLSDAEIKAITVVKKNFHKNNKFKHLFQETEILDNVNEKHSEGALVKVMFTMKRTNCLKHKRSNQDCAPIKKAKRTYNCLGCFIFNSAGDLVKTGYQKCVRQGRAKKQEVKKVRREACDQLKDKIYHVGSYSPQRAPRGHY